MIITVKSLGRVLQNITNKTWWTWKNLGANKLTNIKKRNILHEIQLFAELEENVKIQLNNELEIYYIGIENVDIRIHVAIRNNNGAERLINKIRGHRYEEY